MAKKYKIRRNPKWRHKSTFKARPNPVGIALSVLLLGGLVALGFYIYEPVYDFIVNYSFTRVEEESSASESSEPEPDPDPEPEPDPEPVMQQGIHAVYMPPAIAADAQQRTQFIEKLSGADFNAVMLDTKDNLGNVLFASTNPLAAEWSAVATNAIDLAAVAQQLSDAGLSLVVRQSVFCDQLAARANRDNAMGYRDTEWLWLDAAQESGGKPWLNPYSPQARQYNIDLALEAAQMGAAMVLFDNPSFAPGSGDYASYGEFDTTKGRLGILNEFIETATGALRAQNARLGVYVGGILATQSAEFNGFITQLHATDVVVGAQPNQWGGGDYAVEGLSIRTPLQTPGAAVGAAVEYIKLQYAASSYISQDGRQFSAVLQGAGMTAEQTAEQITAAVAAGCADYILLSDDGQYAILN